MHQSLKFRNTFGLISFSSLISGTNSPLGELQFLLSLMSLPSHGDLIPRCIWFPLDICYRNYWPDLYKYLLTFLNCILLCHVERNCSSWMRGMILRWHRFTPLCDNILHTPPLSVLSQLSSSHLPFLHWYLSFLYIIIFIFNIFIYLYRNTSHE